MLEATPAGALAAAFFQAGVAVHAFETAHYARGKMECWITALAGATLVLAALLPDAAPVFAPAHSSMSASDQTVSQARYPVFFWAWLLLVRFGITHQLQVAAADGGDDDAVAGGPKPDTSNDEDLARALASSYDDADGASDTRAGVFSFYDSDENESKSPVTPPAGASTSRGRTMDGGGSGGMRNRRRSKTPVRR